MGRCQPFSDDVACSCGPDVGDGVTGQPGEAGEFCCQLLPFWTFFHVCPVPVLCKHGCGNVPELIASVHTRVLEISSVGIILERITSWDHQNA